MGGTPVAHPSPPERYVRWASRLGLVGLGILASLGVAVAMIALFAWPGGGEAPEVPGLVEADRVEDFRFKEPVLFEEHGFWLARLVSGELLALSDLDTHVVFREQGCRIRWREDLEFEGRPFMGRAEWFRGNCSGSTFDIDGRAVSGPSPRDMDRYRVVIEGGRVFVDTSRLLCGSSLNKQYEYPEYCVPADAGIGR